MTDQITVPKQTWDAVVEALEHLEAMTERYRPLNAPFPDAQKKARQALTAANAVVADKPAPEPAFKEKGMYRWQNKA